MGEWHRVRYFESVLHDENGKVLGRVVAPTGLETWRAQTEFLGIGEYINEQFAKKAVENAVKAAAEIGRNKEQSDGGGV